MAGLVCAAPFGVSAARAECLENPTRMAQPGHWYYYSDRTHNRRCWTFAPSAPAPVAAAPAPPPQDDDLFSHIATGFTQTFALPPPPPVQPPAAEAAADAAPAAAPQAAPPAPARQQRLVRVPRTARVSAAPARAPVATAPRQAAAPATVPHQAAPADAAARTTPVAAPSDVADRETLYQNFMKWQGERSGFMSRW